MKKTTTGKLMRYIGPHIWKEPLLHGDICLCLQEPARTFPTFIGEENWRVISDTIQVLTPETDVVFIEERYLELV